MADSSSSSSHSFNKTHFQDPIPTSFSSSVPTKPPKSKFLSTHYFVFKSISIILVLLVFSYFPSQVPVYFKKTTIITKLWELIYLLVIGIVVCYGLFSRKTDGVHGSDTLAQNYDNIGAQETYLSGISNISSIFEDGVQGFDGFDEKDLFEECKGLGSSVPKFGNGNGSGKCDGKKVNPYFLGESMVVINDEKYVLEQLGKPKMLKQNKPLCLPVRNLGSKSLDSADRKSFVKHYLEDENNVIEQVQKPQTIKQNRPVCLPVRNHGSKSLDSADRASFVKDSAIGWDETKKGKFRGLVPIKLEEKFKETDSDSNSDSDTQIPLNWRSESMRLEKQEGMCTTKENATSHIRHLSVGVHDFEGLKSQSMRFPMPTQMKNYFDKEESHVLESNPGNRKSYLNGETLFMKSKPREHSIDTSYEMNNRSSSPNILQDLAKIKVDGVTDKASSKEILKDFSKTKVDSILDPNNDAPFIKSKSQRSSIGASSDMNLETFTNVLGKEEKSNSLNLIKKPASTVNTYKRGKSVRTNRPKEQVVEAKVKTFTSQSDDIIETRSKMGSYATSVEADELSDTEPHSGEVDRKAEEFIAKFKEQIRLQKVASARKLNLW